MNAAAPTTIKPYIVTYLALMFLLFATVVVAHFPLGALSAPAAMAIASTKAVLVMIYFMHLRQSPRWTWVVASSALVWLCILVLGVLADYVAREFVL